MKSQDKYELLFMLEHKVEAQLQDAIRIFQNLDETLLLRPSTSGGWSIAQCLEHLNSYGHYYLPRIQHSIEQAPEKNSGQLFKSSWLGNYFVQMMDPATSRKKYKAFRGHIPPPELEPYEVVGEFIRQQEMLLKLLNEAQRIDLNTLKIPLSISHWVKLKLGDIFGFIVAHNERHLIQAKRNLPS